MNIVIVGHGHSLIKARLGTVIDGFDIVCKVKRGFSITRAPMERPECAGERCDAVAGPLRVNFKDINIKGATEFWPARLLKHRNGDPCRWWDDLKELEAESQIKIRTAYKSLCYWGDRYRELEPKCGPSIGLEAVVTALECYHPKELALAGFDAIKTGKTNTWSKASGKDPHPAAIEQKALALMEKHYNTTVRFL